jgi:acyl dehydratase
VILTDVKAGDEIPELSHEVTATTVVLGALASRDWRPMHHDHEFATVRNGVRDIFLNTPNQAAWFERWLTDWTGPKGRLGRLTFQMRTPVFPGDTMLMTGTVTDVSTDENGVGWISATAKVTAGETVCTTCTLRIAVPVDENDNPWQRRGDMWKP